MPATTGVSKVNSTVLPLTVTLVTVRAAPPTTTANVSAAAVSALPALSLFGDTLESVYADYRAEIARNRAAAAHIAHLEAELARLRGGA